MLGKTKPIEKKKDFDEEDTFSVATSNVGFTCTGRMIYDGGDKAYSKLRLKKALIEKKKHILKNSQKIPLYRIEVSEDWQEFDEKVNILRKISPPPSLLHFGEEKGNS
ncbi:MAG: hypothetical protein AABX10_01155 [Nanoarchaeota archaeon]